MATKGTRRAALALVVCSVLGGGGGCAEERPPINRVQANALAKSFFVGDDLVSAADDPEFYQRTTIVDVGYGADGNGLFTSSYAQPVNRIKWEITERLLVARLTHELIEDADHHGSQTTNSGAVMAAFAITSHFDIKRAYNAATGEESNVIEENTSDRAWFERKYFRVDWSQNMVTDAYSLDTMSMLGVDDGVLFSPLAYYVNDPASEDAPVFDGETGYFDVTNRVYAAPKILETPYGNLPACYFRGEIAGGTYPIGNCDPTEVKLRLSFKRIVDTDYEPKDWDYTRFSMFGAFYEERRGWNDEYGVVDSKWHRLGSFYNIWQKSHATDAAGAALPCNTTETTPVGAEPTRDGDEAAGTPANGTADECEAQGAPAGSQCDVLSRKCTLPYAKRTTRAIPWYYGPGSPDDLFDTTSAATAEWDMGLRRAVQGGRLTECRRTNGVSAGLPDRAACDGSFPMADDAIAAAVPEILFLCHSPVVEGDRPGCGAAGTKARMGDLRYNFVSAIPTPQSGSPWGIMVDGVDPLTGEKVQASINVWDSVSKSAAQSAVDVIRWLNGEIAEEDIMTGAYINSYALTGDLKSRDFYAFHTMSKDAVDARLASLDKAPATSTQLPLVAPARSSTELAKLGIAAFEQTYGAPQEATPKIHARQQAALGSPLEAELTTSPFMQIAGLDPATPMDDKTLAMASPMRGNDFGRILELERFKENALAARGTCMVEAPEPQAYVGLSKIMREKFPIDPAADPAAVYDRVVKMRDYLRKKLYFGVVLHEMGHSVGLRHNFVGSYDAFNFRPQYWQLRTKNGAVVQECKKQTADGASCVGPRWFDPLEPDEVDGLIWMWEHTTVMDYPGDTTQDTLGLGPYDLAAARMFYTDTLDVWNTPGEDCLEQTDTGDCKNTKMVAIRNKVGDYGGITGPWTAKSNAFKDFVHYAQFNKEFSLLQNCRPSTKTQPADWDESKDGKWSQVFDGQVVLGTECDGPPKDYIGFSDLETYTLEKGAHRVRWPHMFATDYSADIGNVAVLRHDNGADVFEQFAFLTSTYENRHIFANFRRGRQAFSVRGAALGARSRYHDKMRNIVQGFALFHDYVLRGLNMQTGVDYVSSYEQVDGCLKPNALATTLAFDLFARQLARPQPGTHGFAPKIPGTTLKDGQNDAGDTVLSSQESQLLTIDGLVAIPEGSQRFTNGTPDDLDDDDYGFGARQVNNSLNSGDGSFDIQWLTSAGSYYEKVWSTYHLTESSNRFLDVSLNDFVDGRYRNLSFVNIYPDAFRRMIATALTGDTALLGPRVASQNGKVPDIDVDLKPKQPLGWISWWPKTGPEVCWPIHGSMVCRDPVKQTPFEDATPPSSIAVDGEVGIEVQKFIVYYSLLNLPENWKSDWIDQFRIYSVGGDASPDLPTDGALWFRDPESGILYIARRRGTEEIFGKTVEKGIAARMLAWANLLTMNAYEVDPTTPVDPVTGVVNVVSENGAPKLKNNVAKCDDSVPCIRLRNYKALIDFTRGTAATFGFPAPEPKGIDFN